MTLICYRDGVLAADSAIYCEQNYLGSGNKLSMLDNGCMMGAAGDFDDRRLRAFIGEYAHPSLIPSDELEQFPGSAQAFIVLPNLDCWYLMLVAADEDDGPARSEVIHYRHAFYSCGHGRWVAIGAMAQGASAPEAVKIAIEYSNYTKGPVQTLSFPNRGRGRNAKRRQA